MLFRSFSRCRAAGSGAFEVEALTGAGNIALLAEQARRWRPKLVVTAETGRLEELGAAVAGLDVAVAAGPEAVVEAATRTVDWTMAAIVGAAGLRSAWAAARPPDRQCASRPSTPRYRPAPRQISLPSRLRRD